VARVSILLITVAALIAGMVGHVSPSQNLEIRTWYDLNAIRDNLNGNHTLMNDLDSTTAGYEELASPTANGGKGWQPIGTFLPWTETTFTGFMGTFDGQGYKIRDLFINRPDELGVGLFGEVGQEGIIKDIGVVNATVTGEAFVGGVVGLNRGTLSNSYSSGNVAGVDWFVGGLVGDTFAGTVSNSYSTGNVTGTDGVGGLVGLNDEYGVVSNSYSTGSVTGDVNVGGLVGVNNGTTVSNSFWDIQTSGQATSAGGTGKNTTEMQDIATFTAAAWNIIAVALNETNTAYIWHIVNNVTYPFLSWQPV